MPTFRPLVAAMAALFCAGAFTTQAEAQRGPYYDRHDDRGGRAQDRYDDRGGRGQRNMPGQFDYYALVMSWSPTHCASDAGQRDGNDMQCNRRDGRRYNFVLHGLWPQYERGFPEACPTRDRPFVPDGVIQSMLDIMPARGLIIHEYKKHGTCSGLDPAGYYDLARQLYNRIRIPARYVNPFDVQFVSPEDLMREMLDANPDLKPDMMAISCGGPGNRLKEVRICFTKSGQLRPCGSNENQRRMCSARQMYVPPVRSTWKDPSGGRGGPGAKPDTGGRSEQAPARPQNKPDFLPAPRGI